jgi:hypothetical protein
MSIGFIAYQEAAEKAISIAVAIEKNAPSKRRMAQSMANMMKQMIQPKLRQRAYREATGKVNQFLRDRICCRRREHDIFAQPVSWSRTARKSFGKIVLPWQGHPFSEVLFYRRLR